MMISKIGINKLAYYLVLVLAVTNHVPAYAYTGEQGSAVEAPTHQVQHRPGSLEDRVRALSQALNLDESQQSALRKVLEGQREQVIKVWSDSSVPAAYRISATQAISDRTADQIRALLNEEQKKKYNPPRQSHQEATGTNKRSVEEWMDATRAKETETDSVR